MDVFILNQKFMLLSQHIVNIFQYIFSDAEGS